MQIIEKHLDEIHPYENNPRKNDSAVKYVAASIREFGFKVPIVIDAGGEIVAGHTRYKAAHELGLETVPCVVADNLTPQQIKAFRLADNKTAEMAGWDFEALTKCKNLTTNPQSGGASVRLSLGVMGICASGANDTGGECRR